MEAMIDAIERCHIEVLTMLDFSAVIDTVDHNILLDVLTKRFGVQGNALHWYADFLNGRSQAVRVGKVVSEEKTLQFGLPQGSVLGPKGFIQYAEDVATVFVKHDLIYHLYADDMQGLKHSKPIDIQAIVAAHETCIAEVRSLCTSKRLQLNDDKPKCSGSVQLPTSTRCRRIVATCELDKPS